jgi:hypothetical protein
MSNPQQETKIELVTEAIEALVLAQCVLLRPGHDTSSGPRAHEDLLNARMEVHAALKELLKPTLRVVAPTMGKTPETVVPYAGQGIDGMNLA